VAGKFTLPEAADAEVWQNGIDLQRRASENRFSDEMYTDSIPQLRHEHPQGEGGREICIRPHTTSKPAVSEIGFLLIGTCSTLG
jgi:hypothetical protein